VKRYRKNALGLPVYEAGLISMHVYLAGGFYSNWQELVKKYAPGPTYLDPSATGLKNPAEYTKWDRTAIEISDIVFAYIEPDNPGGYALGYELGYADALRKDIILVCPPQPERERYFGMWKVAATRVVENLPYGIGALRSFFGYDYAPLNDTFMEWAIEYLKRDPREG